jgi:hypothetical protein
MVGTTGFPRHKLGATQSGTHYKDTSGTYTIVANIDWIANVVEAIIKR